MTGIEQLKLGPHDVPHGRAFLRVLAVRGSFDELCKRWCINSEADRDDLDSFRFATLRTEQGTLFQIEQYREERDGYAILLLSGNPSARSTALKIANELALPDGSYTFIDEGYCYYPGG